MRRFWIVALPAVLVAALAPSCLPEFDFQNDAVPDAGSGGSGGGTEAGECAADADCPVARSRCDLATLSCVRCLPENDNCGRTLYCGDGFVCREGCKNDEDCNSMLDGSVFTCDLESRLCIGCTADTDCPPDTVCGETTECVAGCNSVDDCQDGSECCPAATPQDLGSCALTVIEVANCGACGNVCELPENAMEATCIGGTCGFNCEAFYVDCDAMAGNGCEVFTRDDPDNCGDCNQPCAGTCVDGICQ